MPNGKGRLRNLLQRISLQRRSALSNWSKCKEPTRMWTSVKSAWEIFQKLSSSSNNQPLFMSLEIPWGLIAQTVLCWLSRGLCHARKCQFEDIMWGEKVWSAIAQRTFAWETFGKRRNGERKLILILVPGSHERLASRKCVMCARNMGAHVQGDTRRTKGMWKQDEKLDSWKGAKKLVSSNCTKILEKESSD